MAKTKNTVVEPVETTKEIDAPYELPEGWKWVRLGDVADFLGGGTPDKSNSNYWNGNIPWASVKDIKGEYLLATEDFITELGLRESSANLCEKDGLILITRIIPGKAIITKIQTAINQDLKIVNTKENKFFLKYFFDNNQSKIEQLSSGTTVKGIKLEILENIPFPLPSTLKEQQRIVNRIETLFTKLDQAKEKTQNVVDTFETRKASILHKAFTGELTKKWREENGVEDDSWENKKLDEISLKITDGEHSTPRRVDSFCGYYLLSARNIHNGEIRLDDVDYVEESEYERIRKRCNPERNDILISCSGSVGRVCVIKDDNKYVMVRSAAMIKIHECNSFFIAYMLQTFNVQQQIEKTKKQSCQANLFLGAIKELIVPVPSLSEQNEIVHILDKILEKENQAKESALVVLEQIDLLKKSILARAFRGEL